MVAQVGPTKMESPESLKVTLKTLGQEPVIRPGLDAVFSDTTLKPQQLGQLQDFQP